MTASFGVAALPATATDKRFLIAERRRGALQGQARRKEPRGAGRDGTRSRPGFSLTSAPMGLLDDAIKQHLELKRAHGAAEEEVKRQEAEALGPARRDFAAAARPRPSEADGRGRAPRGGAAAAPRAGDVDGSTRTSRRSWETDAIAETRPGRRGAPCRRPRQETVVQAPPPPAPEDLDPPEPPRQPSTTPPPAPEPRPSPRPGRPRDTPTQGFDALSRDELARTSRWSSREVGTGTAGRRTRTFSRRLRTSFRTRRSTTGSGSSRSRPRDFDFDG